jgi:LPS sulfotransferase NodH
MQPSKFVILGHPRCGSTFLCSMLESHPKILCHYEVFHPKEIVTCYGFKDVAEEMRQFTTQTRDENPDLFLKTLFKYNMGAEAVGFKIFIGHSQEAHNIILNDKSILKILLRRNTIDAYVSMLIAEKTGAFTHKEMTPTQRHQVKVALDAGGLLNFDRVTREYYSNIKQVLHETGQKYLEIYYEDLIADQNTINSIFSFLGIERGDFDLSSFTKKQNKKSLEDKIDNCDAVVADFMNLYLEKEKQIKFYEDFEKGLFDEASLPLILLDGKLGFAAVRPYFQVDVSLTTTEDAPCLKLNSHGEDPGIELPEIQLFTEMHVVMRIDISSQQNTRLQVYYMTTSSPHYAESMSIQRAISKGRNILFIAIPKLNIKRLRLDPGQLPGEYLIHAIEVRAIQPGVQSCKEEG